GTELERGRVIPFLADNPAAELPEVADLPARQQRGIDAVEDERGLGTARRRAEDVGIGMVEAHRGALDPDQLRRRPARGPEVAARLAVGRVAGLGPRELRGALPQFDPAVLH